jgi:hypothetical protein
MVVDEQQRARARSARRWRIAGGATRIARVLVLSAVLGLLLGIPPAVIGVDLVAALAVLEVVHQSTSPRRPRK